eukprot:3933275-Rhodomonas_salina.1
MPFLASSPAALSDRAILENGEQMLEGSRRSSVAKGISFSSVRSFLGSMVFIHSERDEGTQKVGKDKS